MILVSNFWCNKLVDDLGMLSEGPIDGWVQPVGATPARSVVARVWYRV